MKEFNYERLTKLNNKVKTGNASKLEKDEYMKLLYENNSITKKQYDDYRNNKDVDTLINAALSVGAIVLIGYLLDKLFSNNENK